jgi:HEAT repeat protein
MKTQTLHQVIQAVAAAIILLVFALGAVPAFAADDPGADAKLQAAREALNAERYRQAAELYAEAGELAHSRELAAHSLYWEAFSRYRLEKTQELKAALALLELQSREYSDVAAQTQAEAEALAARISGELAARGEPDAAREVYEMAEADRQREETRVAALHALMQMNPEKARPILEKIIRGETEASSELRQNAVFILCRQDPDGTEVILAALPTTTDPELLQAMVLCLAQSGDERSLDALVEVMRRTDDPELAQAILVALGHHKDSRAFDILADIARDPSRDPELRANALIGLAQTEDERAVDIAAEIIQHKDEDERVLEMALMTLATAKSERASSALLSLAENPDADDDLRAMALYKAGAQGTLEVGRLHEIYRSTDSRELKLQICHVLAQMDSPDAVDAMLEIVRNEKDPEIRQNAVFWLGQVDDPRAAEVLLEIIEGK